MVGHQQQWWLKCGCVCRQCEDVWKTTDCIRGYIANKLKNKMDWIDVYTLGIITSSNGFRDHKFKLCVWYMMHSHIVCTWVCSFVCTCVQIITSHKLSKHIYLPHIRVTDSSAECRTWPAAELSVQAFDRTNSIMIAWNHKVFALSQKSALWPSPWTYNGLISFRNTITLVLYMRSNIVISSIWIGTVVDS